MEANVHFTSLDYLSTQLINCLIKYWDFRLPNFLALNPSAFSDEDFLKQPDEIEDEKDGSKTLAQAPGILPDLNTIRWRWVKGPDGKAVSSCHYVILSKNSFFLCHYHFWPSITSGTDTSILAMIYVLRIGQTIKCASGLLG